MVEKSDVDRGGVARCCNVIWVRNRMAMRMVASMFNPWTFFCEDC